MKFEFFLVLTYIGTCFWKAINSTTPIKPYTYILFLTGIGLIYVLGLFLKGVFIVTLSIVFGENEYLMSLVKHYTERKHYILEIKASSPVKYESISKISLYKKQGIYEARCEVSKGKHETIIFNGEFTITEKK